MLAILFVLLLIICLYKLSKQSKSHNLPGPWSLPIIGSLYLLDEHEPQVSLTKLSQKYGSIYSMKLGTLNAIVIADAKLLKKVLMRDQTIGRSPLYLFELLTKHRGLVFADGELWKGQRRLVVKYLKVSGATKVPSKRLFEEQVKANMEEFLQSIKHQGDEVCFNPHEAIARYISNTSIVLFLGKAQSGDDQKADKLAEHVADFAKGVAINGALNFLPFLRFLPKFKAHANSVIRAHSKLCQILDNYIAEVTEKNSSSNLIQFFWQQKFKFNNKIDSHEQLRSLIFDVLGASIEAATNSIWWLVLYLSINPKVQSKARNEIIHVLQGREPQFDDLPQLPYIEATIAEAARIRTVVPLGMPHYTMDDLEVENFVIRKGTTIIPLLWAIHMDPKVWTQPELFDPQRFLNDEGKFFQPESFMPFLTGKRSCIGEELAKMEIFIFLAKLLPNFSILPAGSVDLTGICGITLVPKPQETVFRKIK